MSKGQLPLPPSIALHRPLSHWQDLADRIASGDTVTRERVMVKDEDVPVNNYGMKAKATRDPGARNESDPDRFSVSSAMSSVNQLLSRL